MNLSHDDLFSPEIIDVVGDAFRRSKPYVGFLCDALGAEF